MHHRAHAPSCAYTIVRIHHHTHLLQRGWELEQAAHGRFRKRDGSIRPRPRPCHALQQVLCLLHHRIPGPLQLQQQRRCVLFDRLQGMQGGRGCSVDHHIAEDRAATEGLEPLQARQHVTWTAVNMVNMVNMAGQHDFNQ